MYYTVRSITAILCALMGIFMTVCPKKALKESMRDDEEAVKKMRKSGIITTILALMLVYSWVIM